MSGQPISSSAPPAAQGSLWRPFLARRFSGPIVLVLLIFALHAAIRFGGLANAMLIPLSMVFVWPLPWLLSSREGRRRIGIRVPERPGWFALGPLLALAALGLCVAVTWAVFGASASNWFTRHALVLDEALARVPAGTSRAAQFWMVTGPAMIFSPFAEEFLFRGYMLAAFGEALGERAALVLQATAFALVHLAHYGLAPVQPALIMIWVPSMFAVALLLGWIVRRSGSLWPAVLTHAVFNLGLNATVFILLPGMVG